MAKRNEKLVKLLNGVAEMNLGEVKDHSIDAFGDAYEYLMTMYASNAGKSGGEFFTPADVSELLTRLTARQLLSAFPDNVPQRSRKENPSVSSRQQLH